MKTKAWQRTIGALSFLPILFVTDANPNLIWSFVVYLAIALTITSGYHRLFSHATYECNNVWKFLYGFIGTASLNSSPVEWASVHIAHHIHSDTQSDPYDSTWRQFFKFKERTDIHAPRVILRLLKDGVHLFWVRHSFIVACVTAIVLLAIDRNLFLFGYAIPVTGYLFTSYLHNIVAHIGQKPHNFPILELLVPMCGEWIHKQHHENPRLNHFGTLDLGGHFIGLIRNDK